MPSLPIFIYLKPADEVRRPLSISQFIFSYSKKWRDKLLKTPGACYSITSEGKPLSSTELSNYVRKMELSLEKQIFEQCFSRKDFAQYVEDFPEGKYVSMAKDMIERLDFRSCQTAGEYASYLKDYPTGRFASLARKKLANHVEDTPNSINLGSSTSPKTKKKSTSRSRSQSVSKKALSMS